MIIVALQQASPLHQPQISQFFLKQQSYLHICTSAHLHICTFTFSGLALLVTLMGIMGVAAYTAQQRQKEIAIRKTFGASPARIFRALFANYLVLIFTAAVLIFPVAYFWLNNWLAQFASRVSISPLSILFPLVLVTATTLLTVWLQSNRILRVNPADVLKE